VTFSFMIFFVLVDRLILSAAQRIFGVGTLKFPRHRRDHDNEPKSFNLWRKRGCIGLHDVVL